MVYDGNDYKLVSPHRIRIYEHENIQMEIIGRHIGTSKWDTSYAFELLIKYNEFKLISSLVSNQRSMVDTYKKRLDEILSYKIKELLHRVSILQEFNALHKSNIDLSTNIKLDKVSAYENLAQESYIIKVGGALIVISNSTTNIKVWENFMSNSMTIDCPIDATALSDKLQCAIDKTMELVINLADFKTNIDYIMERVVGGYEYREQNN